jgi:hypothetical protein
VDYHGRNVSLIRAFDDLAGSLRHFVIAQVSASDPFDAGDIISRAQFSACDRTHIIQQQVVVLSPAASISHHPFENAEHLHRLHAQPGFLQYFAPDSLVQALAGFDQSSRYRPISFERMPAALDQKDRSTASASTKNQRTHTG